MQSASLLVAAVVAVLIPRFGRATVGAYAIAVGSGPAPPEERGARGRRARKGLPRIRSGRTLS